MTHTTESLMALADEHAYAMADYVSKSLKGALNATHLYRRNEASTTLHSAIAELVAERDALAKENERHKMHIKNIGNAVQRAGVEYRKPSDRHESER